MDFATIISGLSWSDIVGGFLAVGAILALVHFTTFGAREVAHFFDSEQD